MIMNTFHDHEYSSLLTHFNSIHLMSVLTYNVQTDKKHIIVYTHLSVTGGEDSLGDQWLIENELILAIQSGTLPNHTMCH